MRLVVLIVPLIVACRSNDTVSALAHPAAESHHAALDLVVNRTLGLCADRVDETDKKNQPEPRTILQYAGMQIIAA